MSGFTNKRRVQLVDVILVNHRLVKASQAGRDLLRQLRIAVVKQPGQEKSEQSGKNRNPGEDQLGRMPSLRFGAFRLFFRSRNRPRGLQRQAVMVE